MHREAAGIRKREEPVQSPPRHDGAHSGGGSSLAPTSPPLSRDSRAVIARALCAGTCHQRSIYRGALHSRVLRGVLGRKDTARVCDSRVARRRRDDAGGTYPKADRVDDTLAASARNDERSAARRPGTHLGFRVQSSLRKHCRAVVAFVFIGVGPRIWRIARDSRRVCDAGRADETLRDRHDAAGLDHRFGGRARAEDGARAV